MTVLSINMAKQIQFVGKNFMRNFKPVVEVLDFCESKKVCLLMLLMLGQEGRDRYHRRNQDKSCFEKT